MEQKMNTQSDQVGSKQPEKNGKNSPLKKERKVAIVAVDGPAGSGKSTICRLAGEKLGWAYVSTGKLYRAIGILAKERGIALDDDDALAVLATEFAEKFDWLPTTDELFFDGRKFNEELYSEEAGASASKVAIQPKFRSALLSAQRKMASLSDKGALFDGRDVGTVVFPDATCKIYMTASLEKRAQRRLQQLDGKLALVPTLAELMADIEARDRQDSSRSAAPLAQAEDSIFFDTSDLSLEQSVEKMVAIINEAVT